MNEEPALIQHYSERLESLGIASSLAEAVQRGEAVALGNLTVILRHTDRVTREPDQARAEHIEALLGAGLEPRDIVVLLQLIAFVNFQARLIAGLRLLQEAQ